MRLLLATLVAGMLSLAAPAGASTFAARFEGVAAGESEAPPATFKQRYASLGQTVYWSNDILYHRGAFGYWQLPEPEGIRMARLAARRAAAQRQRIASLGPVHVSRPNAFDGGMFAPQNIAKSMLQQKLSIKLGEMGVQYAGVYVCTAFSFGSMVVDGIQKHEHWTPLDTLGNLAIISLPNCIFPFAALKNAKTPLEALLIAANGAAPYFVPAYGAIPWQVRQTVIDGIVKATSPPQVAARPQPKRKKHARR